ncbi:hypothetical protein P5704_024360 (plasmid) [Pseudomonas sp. FeN3W]|nr:hypothetical protein P5704_024360 [Pseudomonas sp. FeN3W]
MTAYRVDFRLGSRIAADDARAGSAKLMSGVQEGLVGALMNYEVLSEDERRTKNALAPVHFASIKDGFSLIGYGETGKSILNDVTHLLAEAWSKHLGLPVRLNSQEIPTGIQSRPYRMMYTVPRIVIQKKSRHRDIIKTAEQGKPHVEGLILRGLKKHAEMLCLSLPDNLEINFVGCDSNFAAKLGHGGACLAGMKGVRFEANAALKGYWTMGYITSKGYGLLNADMSRGGLFDAPFQ